MSAVSAASTAAHPPGEGDAINVSVESVDPVPMKWSAVPEVATPRVMAQALATLYLFGGSATLLAVLGADAPWADRALVSGVRRPDRRTIQAGLLGFSGQYGQTDWGSTFAAVSLAVLPTLIVYLLLNQKVMKGLAAGSVKG